MNIKKEYDCYSGKLSVGSFVSLIAYCKTYDELPNFRNTSEGIPEVYQLCKRNCVNNPMILLLLIASLQLKDPDKMSKESVSSFKVHTSNIIKGKKDLFSLQMLNKPSILSKFDQDVRSAEPKSLEKIKLLVRYCIDRNKLEDLVKSLLAVIACDVSIADNAEFFVKGTCSPVTKTELLTVQEYTIEYFLLGVWHYIVCSHNIIESSNMERSAEDKKEVSPMEETDEFRKQMERVIVVKSLSAPKNDEEQSIPLNDNTLAEVNKEGCKALAQDAELANHSKRLLEKLTISTECNNAGFGMLTNASLDEILSFVKASDSLPYIIIVYPNCNLEEDFHSDIHN